MTMLNFLEYRNNFLYCRKIREFVDKFFLNSDKFQLIMRKINKFLQYHFFTKEELKLMSKNKKRALIILAVILLILITIGVCYFLFTRKDANELQYDDNATTGILPGVDVDERRKELQNQLDRSMIAFSINTSPVFLNGTDKGNLLIENPGNNAKLLRVSIVVDKTEEEVYASKYLKPGTYIENVKLDKVLKKGTYNATAYFKAYEEESGEYIGQTGAQITITVQN